LARVSGFASNKLRFACPCPTHPAKNAPSIGSMGMLPNTLIFLKPKRREVSIDAIIN